LDGGCGAAVPGEDPVVVAVRGHGERLEDADGFDGGREFGEVAEFSGADVGVVGVGGQGGGVQPEKFAVDGGDVFGGGHGPSTRRFSRP
jgi:hypothetical protein